MSPVLSVAVVAVCVVNVAACGVAQDSTASSGALEHAFTGRGDSADVDYRWAAARSDKSVVISKLTVSDLPGVLDSLGNVLTVLGRPGRGPGEFTAPAVGTIRADSIIISDFNSGLMLFDPAGNFVRSLPYRVMGAHALLLMRGDTLLLVQPLRTPDRFGLPFHILPPGEGAVRSFGSDDRSVSPDFVLRERRVVAGETDSTFWSARRDRYTLERWHINGTRIAVIEPDRSWFPPMSKDPGPLDQERPSTTITSLVLDSHGHLLVLLQRARDDWRPSGGQQSHVEPGTGSVLSDRLQHIEQLIEVLDTATGSLVKTIRNHSDTYLVRLLTDGRVISLGTGPYDRQIATVWRVSH